MRAIPSAQRRRASFCTPTQRPLSPGGATQPPAAPQRGSALPFPAATLQWQNWRENGNNVCGNSASSWSLLAIEVPANFFCHFFPPNRNRVPLSRARKRPHALAPTDAVFPIMSFKYFSGFIYMCRLSEGLFYALHMPAHCSWKFLNMVLINS